VQTSFAWPWSDPEESVSAKTLTLENGNAKREAAYLLSIENLPIGTATVKTTDSLIFQMKIFHQVGEKPMFSKFLTTVQPDKTFVLKEETNLNHDGLLKNYGYQVPFKNKTVRVPFFIKDTSFWFHFHKMTKMTDAKLNNTHKDLLLNEKTTVFPDKQFSLIGQNRKVTDDDVKKVWIPFLEREMSTKDLSLQWGPDGFLQSAHIPWQNNLTVFMERTSLKTLENLSFINKTVDLEQLSSLQPSIMMSDVARIARRAGDCTKSLNHMEVAIRTQTPQLPYLLLRKVINAQFFCDQVSQILGDAHDGILLKFSRMRDVFKALKDEDTRELPKDLAKNLLLFDDFEKKTLFLNSLKNMIDGILFELQANWALEKNIRTTVALKLSSSQLPKRAVLKGVLRAKNVNFSFGINDGDFSQNQNTILKSPPRMFFRTTKKSSQDALFLDGKSFAQGLWTTNDLENVCKLGAKSIGLDLGDGPPAVFRTPFLTGSWDYESRIRLASTFALVAASTGECEHVMLRSPKWMQTDLTGEMVLFLTNVIRTQYEFQFSNGVPRNFRFLPGVYELFVSSLVDNKILMNKEVNISQMNQQITF